MDVVLDTNSNGPLLHYLTQIASSIVDKVDTTELYYEFGMDLKDYPNLEILRVSHQLDTLPDLPSGLKELWCARNSITSLPDLPEGLILLDCSHNELTTLPDLPPTLRYLDCSHNELTTLPDLPTLRMLLCPHNELTTLPDLPTLECLHCSHNKLTTLPKLPDSLKVLFLKNNQLTETQDIPLGLEFSDFTTTKEFTFVGENDKSTCSICLNSNEEGNVSKLQCGHYYHSECVIEWFKKNSSCPLCRSEVKYKMKIGNIKISGVLKTKYGDIKY